MKLGECCWGHGFARPPHPPAPPLPALNRLTPCKLRRKGGRRMFVRGVVCAVLFTTTASASPARDAKPAASGHTMVAGDRIVWGPGPPALPPGASAVVLSGNPAEAGPFTIRLKLPAGYRIPPHRHPVAEHQTILEGTYSVGTGERFDDSALHAMRAGSFAIMPAGMPHFGY